MRLPFRRPACPDPAPSGARRVGRAAKAGAALGLVAALAAAGAARAEPPLTVVELFTSQGCSSCPPADELLAELAERSDVLALSLHVDYWDYLGWKDVFAMPAFSKRQAAYGEAAGARSVYTPQVIVQGDARVVGSHREQVLEAVAAAARQPRPAAITLTAKDDALVVHVRPLVPDAPGGVLWFVTFHNPAPVTIARGENAGREVVYRNVARSWMKLGRWDGAGEAEFSAPTPAGDAQDSGVAVILQQGYVGPVLAAALLRR